MSEEDRNINILETRNINILEDRNIHILEEKNANILEDKNININILENKKINIEKDTNILTASAALKVDPIDTIFTPPEISSENSLWSTPTTNIQESKEEEDCCRICHCEAEVNKPLFHPCKCSGSVKFIHQECLQTWLKVSKQSNPKCELCGTHFNFRNIYATGNIYVYMCFMYVCISSMCTYMCI